MKKNEVKQSTKSVPNLSQLKQTDGRVEKKELPRTLAQFFGDSVAGRYKTTDETEYTNFLKGLNKSDLQAHAIRCGLVPKDDRQRLVSNLIREFKRVVASYKPLPVVKHNNSKITPETMKILARGR